MKRSRWTAAAAALAAVLVAGCATTIAGTAEPNPVGLASMTGTSASSVTVTSSSDTSSTDTSSTDTSSTDTSSTDTSSTDTSSTEASTSSSTSTDSSTYSSAGSSTQSSTSTSSGSTAAYPTTPLEYNRTPSTQSSANLLEGRRIASALVVPTFIDPAYTRNSGFSTLPLRGPSAMSSLFVAPVPTVAGRAGMITGFSSARRSPTGGLLVAAFEFGTAAQAGAAVPALAAASVNKEFDKGKAAVPGYPAAAGLYGSTTSDGPYLQSFLAQGRMVLYVYISGKKQTTAQQSALAAKTFKAQSSAFATFQPTAPTALMQLPVDADGMLAHTIPNTGEDMTVFDGNMTAAGQLHYDTDPVGTKSLFASAGVDAVGGGRTTLYRAKTASGAEAVRDAFLATSQRAASMRPYQLTATAPGAKCLQEALDSKYYCVGVRSRYAFEVSADSEGDINAAMGAQYQLLSGF
jgi:hypothetical protein